MSLGPSSPVLPVMVLSRSLATIPHSDNGLEVWRFGEWVSHLPSSSILWFQPNPSLGVFSRTLGISWNMSFWKET